MIANVKTKNKIKKELRKTQKNFLNNGTRNRRTN